MYCNAEDVAMLLGMQGFSDDTNPSLTRVVELINIISAEIDFIAKAKNIKFDDNILIVLRKKAAMGVAGLILLSYLNNNQNSGSQANEYIKEYREFLLNMQKDFNIRLSTSSSNFLDGTTQKEWWRYDYYDDK